MTAPGPSAAPLRVTVTISLDAADLVASRNAAADLETVVAGLLEACPGARVTVDHAVEAVATHSDFPLQE